jgi:hypothetical protein
LAGDFSISDADAVEGADAFITFRVTRDGVNNPAATVDFATADGSAQAGSDYTAKSDTLSFAAGEFEKFIQVPVLDDAVWEPSERSS